VLDSDWEAEFCRVAESHPKVIAYTKNHNLGLEVPYRYGSETRKYLPDFVVHIDDGYGSDDGNSESRGDTVSVFNGPPPTIRSLKSEKDEIEAVATWMAEQVKAGVMPHEFGVFVRSEAQLDRAQGAAKKAGLAFKILDEHVETTTGYVSITTMHLAKGLEFRAVVVMACDDEVIPLQERIETVGDDADLQEVYDSERQLLYVACTRARDHLLVTGVEPVSEFLDDFIRSNRRS
jgi:superfamily I DNA/RNA helicase